MKYFALFGIMLLLGPTHANSCTIFKTTQSEKTLVGNNEDWVEANGKVWFLTAVPGKRGRVLFGFENGWAQGGMNDQGLFFDGIAGEVQDWAPASHREDFPGNLCEMILEKVATVDDAIAYFERYNFPSLVVGRFVFIDATGSTAAISYVGGRLNIERFAESTVALGYRGEEARDLLNDAHDIDVQAMANILKVCQRRDEYSTQYSNVYDPLGLKVHVYPSSGAVREVTLNLEQELAKEDHYYDLASLSEQMGKELIVDHKTRPAVKYLSSSLDDCIGQYGLDTSSVTITRSGNSLLLRSELIFEAVMAFEIVPVAEDHFYARHLAIEVEFQRNRLEQIEALLLAYDGRVFSLKRK
ncbi:MAG: hypothetical protein KJ970_03445 [Candidatus Eisenbacteria bacterium]|uniref:DUF3471 domain-containing protein n=1 Tax=Eiseniibacteriota bacterium TaxID=2212470 RepID=A0A948RSB1_UNCEI|nr:hypothetical protein [Candidatus Eisenbacteria bacterium]MBU2689955.1 hypothetical protein [Candidatus Eisenbacteria bacterium]